MKNTSRWLASMLLAGPLTAQAVSIDYGTAEFVTARNCIAGVTACDVLSPIQQSQYGGNPGDSLSTASAVFPGFGSASGTVSLSGTIGAPVLHASASSLPGERTNTNSIALQRYTYTGSTATTRTFGGTLSYAQTITGAYPGDSPGVFAEIDIFTLPTAFIDVGSTSESNFNTLSDVTVLPGYSSLGLGTYGDAETNPAGSADFGVTVTLNPGDSVFTWVYLYTPAPNGSFVDASDTFITSWNDPTDLTPAASVAVAEPATAGLLGLGMLAAWGMGRRRRVI